MCYARDGKHKKEGSNMKSITWIIVQRSGKEKQLFSFYMFLFTIVCTSCAFLVCFVELVCFLNHFMHLHTSCFVSFINNTIIFFLF